MTKCSACSTYLRYVIQIIMALAVWLAWAPGAEAAQAAWTRSPAISPDGKSVAFVSKGQIRVVPVSGGTSIALTPEGVYSHAPVWSPDGRSLAFASDINGADNVFVASIDGGTMERRTFASTPEVPSSFSPDGKSILFTASRLGDPKASLMTIRNNMPQLYSVPTAGGRAKIVLPTQAEEARWNKQGTQLVYLYATNSIDRLTRQRRTVADAGELWLYDAATKKHTPLVKDGKDARNPVWSANGHAVFYLSERSGLLNVWKRDLKTAKDIQLTHFTNDPVRGLSASQADDLVFTHNGRLYLLRAGQMQPQVVGVDVPEFRNDQEKTFLDHYADGFDVSPNGKFFALTVRGNIFFNESRGQKSSDDKYT